jgi:hypothetical protein
MIRCQARKSPLKDRGPQNTQKSLKWVKELDCPAFFTSTLLRTVPGFLCRGRDGGFPPPAVLRTDPDVRYYLILSSRSYLEFPTPEASLYLRRTPWRPNDTANRHWVLYRDRGTLHDVPLGQRPSLLPPQVRVDRCITFFWLLDSFKGIFEIGEIGDGACECFFFAFVVWIVHVWGTGKWPVP